MYRQISKVIEWGMDKMYLGYDFDAGVFDVRFLLIFYLILILQAVLSLRKNYWEGLILPLVAIVYALLLFMGFKAHYVDYRDVSLYFLGVCQFFPVSLFTEYLFVRIIRVQMVQYYSRMYSQKQE